MIHVDILPGSAAPSHSLRVGPAAASSEVYNEQIGDEPGNYGAGFLGLRRKAGVTGMISELQEAVQNIHRGPHVEKPTAWFWERAAVKVFESSTY